MVVPSGREGGAGRRSQPDLPIKHADACGVPFRHDFRLWRGFRSKKRKWPDQSADRTTIVAPIRSLGTGFLF